MNMQAKYRVRFRIVSLLGRAGELQPLQTFQAWRATFILNGGNRETVLDGVPFGSLTTSQGSVVQVPVSFTVGGVFMPDGTPALVDQQTFIGQAVTFTGILILEYLEPLEP